jgi:isopentenyl diphosphate isomerase/L-lactate dehydrogenase-like FMN-dependent dehydrogenase
MRSGFSLPAGIGIRNLEKYGTPDALRWAQTSSFTEYVHQLLDAGLTWDAVDWLRSVTSLPVLIKGILTAEDAALALAHGASGIVVSNHGGRQLDGAIATIDALPAIADEVAGRVPVLLDGGIRRGTDVFKALALGARAVLVGRAYLWGLAADGESGVSRVLEMLGTELELTMALAGARELTDISRAHVRTV